MSDVPTPDDAGKLTSSPPVAPMSEEDRKREIGRRVADLQRQAANLRSDEAVERALSFCYSILAPGQDATAIIAANPGRAREAHRAIYERKPRAVSYDTMMDATHGSNTDVCATTAADHFGSLRLHRKPANDGLDHGRVEQPDLLTRKGIENYYRCGFREARYFFDPSVAGNVITPEEDEAVKWFMSDHDRQRAAMAANSPNEER